MYKPVLVSILSIAALALAQPMHINPSKLVDMTYAFDAKTIHWPTAKPFEWKKDVWGKREDGRWYSSATFTTSEHVGTHLDSPIHFSEGKMTLEQIPVSRFIGSARVIDITKSCAENRDYQLAASDIAQYEQSHGKLKEGDIVLVHTGWGRFWPNPKQYLGDDTPGDASHLSFPGVGPDAAHLLVARRVSGVGIDTASLDYGPSKDFPTHRILNGASVYGLENVANLGTLPAVGATLIALPVKVKGGTGGPARIIAILP